jgi:hypothetical protein
MRHKVIVTLITLSFGLTGYSVGAGWSKSFQFSPQSFTVEQIYRDGRAFSLLAFKKDPQLNRYRFTVDYTRETGKPTLPLYSFTLVIPQGMKPGSVTVTPANIVTLKAENPPFPAQPPVPISQRNLPQFVEPDPTVYQGTNPWPENLISVSSVGIKSGFRLVTITLNPVRYDPKTQSYIIASKLNLSIIYEPDPAAENITLTEKQQKLFSAAVQSIVANPEDVSRYAPPKKETDFGTYDYVIITNSALEPYFQPLVNWRTKMGYSTVVRTTSWINSNYSGRDLQEKIRNFIRDYFNNYGTMWVLLGGDNSVVPCRQARAYCAGYTGNIPCDLYYVDLQWSWDSNNDNIFGEYGRDTTDLYYDLYVGRASVDDTNQVKTFVNKVITHETNPPTDYLRRILLVEAFLWNGYNDSMCNDSIRNLLPSGWTEVRIHYPTNTTMVRDSLNHGFQFAHLVGHGDDVGIYHNSTAYYSTSVTSGHNNGSRVGLINSIACYPGNFEYSDCLAEASHNCATGGALNVIMNSRYGWGTPPSLGPSEKLDIRFYDYFFNHDTMPIGLTHAESKEVYRYFANISDGAWRWCYFELNYFGDPLQLMYEQVPAQLDAQFASPINIGIQNFTVTVRSGSNPVSGALVCLWKGSEVYTRNYTNAAGQVTFSINPTTQGYLYVTATKPNYLPDRDSARVIATNLDVGVSRIIQPTGTVEYGTPIVPQARVRNYSPVPVTNCPVRFTIGTSYTADTIIPYIGAHDSALALFSVWSAQPAGNLAVRCSTMLAGDTYPANNRLSSSVFVRYRDVGVVSISVPATVDSGTVVPLQATVRNYGNTDETFPIVLSISGTSYNQTRTKTLAAGTIDTVNFPSWTALQRGTRTVRCSTELSSDNNPSNDRATANVFVRVRDVACTKILAPIGNVDSTSSLPVQARVRNLGNTTENFRAIFRITGTTTWLDSALVNNLAPGESVNVSFSNWPCGPRGTYTTACSTKLAGDLVPANDRITGSFVVAVHDIAARAIVSPSAFVDSNSMVPVRVTVANFGSVQENVRVFVRIGSFYNDSLLTTINPGALDTINLTPWRVNAPRGTVPVRCSVYVANDANRNNDTVGSSTTVLVHDVAAVAIIAPIGDVDSGAVVVPRVRIRNLGSTGEVFFCRFTITDGYLAQLSVSLTAGADTVISFPDWYANTPGLFSTRCTTLLSRDQNPANDRAIGTVGVVGTDVGVVQIVAPTGDADPGDITPVARVANYSPTARSFKTFLKITGSSGTVFSDSVLVNLLPKDSTRDVQFSTWRAAPGIYTVRCSVGLGDPNPRNDTLSTVCRVVMRDVGLVSLSPQGDMRPMIVSPLARVKNFGSIPSACQVFLTIIDTVSGSPVYYDSVSSTDLAPGETRDLRLPSWAATIGYYRLIAAVVAPGDAEPTNDSLNVKLRVSPGALGWQRRPDLPPGANPVKHGGALTGVETDSARIYALRGNKTPDFYVYNVQSGIWRVLPSMPTGPSGKPVRKGGALCSDGERYVYATKGNGTLEFWRYDVINNTWTQLPDVPAGSKTLKGGTGLAYVNRDNNGFVYLLKGSNTFEFYVYSVETNTWRALAQAPAGPSGKKFKSGSALCAHNSDHLYAIKSKVNEFYQYSIAEDAWYAKTPVPDYSSSGKRSRCGEGCGITSDGNNTLYALTGGNRNYFYCFNLTTNNWYELSEMPEGPSGKRVKAGGALTFLRRQVWALRGNGTNEFYVYIPDTMNLFSPPAPRRNGISADLTPRTENSIVALAPNPAHRILTITAPANTPLKIELFNSLGTLVKSELFPTGPIHRIDVSNLTNGIYLVRMSTPSGTVQTRKLVIQH